MYYVIQVQTGKELKTIKEINERVNPDILKYEAFMPMFEVIKKFKGIEKKIVKSYFPGYIFVETDNPNELFKQLTYVPSFTKLLGRYGIVEENLFGFECLNDYEERTLDILCSKHMDRVTRLSTVKIKEGMKIQILDGPLKGNESIIKKVNLHKKTVTINLPIAGRENLIDVGIDIVSEMI